MPITIPQADGSHPAQVAQIPGQQIPLGYTQIIGTGAAVGLGTLPTKVLGAQTVSPSYALIQASGGIINWRDDGTAATSGTGLQIPAGAELSYNGNLAQMSLYIPSGTIANIAFYA